MSRLKSDLRASVTDSEMSANPESPQCKSGLHKRLIIGIAVAFLVTIGGGLFLWDSGGFNYMSAIYSSNAFPGSSATNHFIQNDMEATTSKTITIRTFDVDWYTLATVDVPLKVVAGRQLNFILDIGNSSSSLNSIVVTITDNRGQYVLFFPLSQLHKSGDKGQFEYAFPSPATYNVDITFGGPAAANFNVIVEKNGESAT